MNLTNKNKKNKKSNKIKNILALILIITVAETTIAYSANIPGTEQNPIISLEYLEERLSSLEVTITEEQLSMIIQTVTANVLFHIQINEGAIPTSLPQFNTLQQETSSYNFSFVPIFLEAGTILTGDYGTEIILRSGNVLAYVYGYDGIVNITAGTEHFADEVLSHNELLLIPRRGPRGIRVITDAWVMIRGDYFIR